MLRGASLGRRLLFGAGIFIAIALVIAGAVIFFVLHRFVQGQIDQRLDTQLVFLGSMLRADDGVLALNGNADGPPFDRPQRGWYWQIAGPKNMVVSRSLGGATLELPDVVARVRPPPPGKKDGGAARGARPSPADGRGPDDQALHFRMMQVSISGVPVTIVASAPRDAVLGPLREAMTTLAISLAVLGAALVLAMVLQVWLGLRPLERLRIAVADVRAGRRDSVPEQQPREILPLATELNGLLAQNSANLERARRHVANLAHGLKTPLATLAVALPKEREQGRDLRDLVDLMERRIRHHLGRARAAALSGPVRTQTVVASRVADLGSVLTKVHADKAVDLRIDIPGSLAVACEPQDFDEMAGNLLENAFKWAGGAVQVDAQPTGQGTVRLVVDDDGPGLSAEQIARVIKPGERLDESAPGFGFGLSITRELAELYGGSLDLESSRSGGLRAELTLPLATSS
jgi:signal transduction histidine kinase